MSDFEVQVRLGGKPAESDLVGVSELLMRQLLKLDGIEADGDAKALRRTEVCKLLPNLSDCISVAALGNQLVALEFC